MDITILNTNLTAVAVIDTYESFIWTDRYYSYGDFELYSSITDGMFDYIKQDYYLVINKSEHAMIIEKITIASDVEKGNRITITGRSLESILNRRIVWGQKTLSGNIQNGIQTLLNENIISPTDNSRKIDNFIFELSTDTWITALDIYAQYTGDNLYDVVQALCEGYNIGFKITINDNKQFVFKLYFGVSRTYYQSENPYVVFSPNFENLMNSKYIESKSSLKNVTLIGGEGEGAARKYATTGVGSGLNRRELFTDARDISSDVGNGVTLTPYQYELQLQQRGKEKLSENVAVVSFDGEADTFSMFKYGEDFFIGDEVQFADEYGHETTARIIEMIISEDSNGNTVYPTFKTA